MAESKLIFGYWFIQAFGHPTRLLLAYHKVPFEEKSYHAANRDEWFAKDKPELKTPLPNLPFIKDGELVITESLALIQYAALKTGQKDLFGKNDLDSIRIYQLWSVCRDLLTILYNLSKNPEFEKVKEEIMKEKIAPFLDKFAEVLGEQDYPIGYLTWADFYLYYIIDIVRRLSSDFVAGWPTLLKYHERIDSNEGIQTYRKSENYPRLFMSVKWYWSGEEKI